MDAAPEPELLGLNMDALSAHLQMAELAETEAEVSAFPSLRLLALFLALPAAPLGLFMYPVLEYQRPALACRS